MPRIRQNQRPHRQPARSGNLCIHHSPCSRASHRIRPGDLHAVTDVFLVEEMEVSEADVGNFSSTERRSPAQSSALCEVARPVTTEPMRLR